jgi:orotate phosphoribosyltransferase
MERKNIKGLKSQLLALLKQEAFRRGNFLLSSGKSSNYYLDARVVTLSSEGAYLVASIILEMVEGDNINALGGPTIGADPIVGAVACLSHLKANPLKTFIVRKAAKEHGTQRQIEGPLLENGDRVVLVDDVVTTGKALVEAKSALVAAGVEVVKAIVIVDRNEGGRENLKQAGLVLEPIFTIADFGIYNDS